MGEDETDVYVCVCIEERNDFDGGVGGVVTTLKCNFYISPQIFQGCIRRKGGLFTKIGLTHVPPPSPPPPLGSFTIPSYRVDMGPS